MKPSPSSQAGAREINFDGLVGPTHNYAGLSRGNIASTRNVSAAANPKLAALEGLTKMQALAARGFAQAVLPPQMRPDLGLLRSLGFDGGDAQILHKAARAAPQLLAAAWSASSMWTANAATVSPAADCADGRAHFTVANLSSKLHRAIESRQTARTLRAIFGDARHFAVHDALPTASAMADEGAANHARLAPARGAPGVELFVHGRSEFDPAAPMPKRFPARQTLEAGMAVARLHGLQPARCVFAQQHPEVIDQGVFHNDVIAVANGSVLFYHESAFLHEAETLAALHAAAAPLGFDLLAVRVAAGEVSVADAVSSYLFNSQLLTRPDGRMLLVAPRECMDNPAVAAYLARLIDSQGPIAESCSFDLRQSMQNGGGPACLRLRVELTAAQAAAMHQGVMLDDALYGRLVAWVERHYRDRLLAADLADPALLEESRRALEELAEILNLPGLYATID
ncbi:N-succinylarginine dihydrolase [Oxalobacteraceae bacterium CAVE-383]|nr:N-succinylarginine dihydrolase [Oxalobacteraceae bacterium CAVE-383]